MKITDMIISAIVKKGIVYEARNVDVDFEIPTDKVMVTKEGDAFKQIKVHVKVDHMTLQVEKDD